MASDLEFAAVQIASVGWLVHDGDDVKALAPNVGGLDGKTTTQVSGVINIPTRCITSILPLKEQANSGKRKK